MHWGTRAGVTVALEGQKVASLPAIKIADVASSLFADEVQYGRVDACYLGRPDVHWEQCGWALQT